MGVLRNRSFLTLRDFSRDDILSLLTLSAELKMEKKSGTETKRLQGKNIALIFEQDSTRTRVGFEVAAYDQGANVTYLGPSGTQLGHKESIKDTARVLGRMYDAIEYRGFRQADVEVLANHSGVPVFNGLTNEYHPTQILADLLTMTEHTAKPLTDVAVCFLGDIGNSVANSLMIGCAKIGIDLCLCGPDIYQPPAHQLRYVQEEASRTGARISLVDNVSQATRDCDFVYTDVWVRMGEPHDQIEQRVRWLSPYRVTTSMMKDTGNPATRFMHRLPAMHDQETVLSRELKREFNLDAFEVTDDVFESDASIVFDQAENHLHAIKALMVATLS